VRYRVVLISVLAKPFISALLYTGGIITLINLSYVKRILIFKTLSS
jgi:hypothetical protein